LKACNLGDKYGCNVFLLNAEVRSIYHWQNWFEPVAPAPEALIELLRVDNIVNGYSERPVPAKASAQFVSLLKDALHELPPVVSRVLGRKLVAIFLVEQLGSSAYNLGLFDQSGPSGSSIIVLDVTKLTRKANEWATWKENTPFATDPSLKLEVTIEEEAANNVKNAIQYIVLHEMGHVLERAGKHSPSKDEAPSPAFLSQFPFLAQSWVVTPNGYMTKFDTAFPERGKIRFYADTPESRVPLAVASEAYRKLEATNFVSLYAATNPWDDFAESFVSYVHSILQKRPYKVELKKGGKTVRSLSSCWQDSRCQEKRKFFEKVFSSTQGQ
jgi:hypothetical protein